MDIVWGSFLWDLDKDKINRERHGVPFAEATETFKDPKQLILEDKAHSEDEPRWYCIGRVGDRILTVRFTYRGQLIRIIGAGCWRKWRKLYEIQEEKI